ncbi:MAG TPA: alpha-amylase family glycosyl hydrolase [Syntrophorhabdaceae bacterium]
MEFHISRKARERYQFDESIFSFSGNVIFADFRAARVFAQKMNRHRDLKKTPEKAVKPGHITAMGLIDETMHYIVARYRREVNKNVMAEVLEALSSSLGKDELDKALRAFSDEFPPVAVYRGEISLDVYMAGATEGVPNREIALEEMLLLWLANMNPAFAPFMELFDDTTLTKTTVYPHIISGIRKYFDSQPGFGPEGQHLVDMLRAPAINSPDSLSGQLEYIKKHWGVILGNFLRRILKSLDIFREEEKLTFSGPGRPPVINYRARAAAIEHESEEFSPDKDWMPRLVLMAKNIYVWLDQLSRQYGRSISKLDEIPDAELDSLQYRGFSGLWLIGVWERSPSSSKIKQLCGNPEAVPSAYSLYDYTIATDLGGEEGYGNLRDRAWLRNIRLASDMVPNHVGIYSKWTVEHPDWFVSLDYSPFPWYTFQGPDLSQDDSVGIFVEDHYYNRSDAAVVFKRVDRRTGAESYVYHGNDGTSMPWNDTAQLNYLNPAVREAMIRTIIHVAKKFPVIRFDAAMTLTKRHYQRLWFPEPGSGGAIPTRAEFGLTKEEFNDAMPKEFWREVVDRVAAEAPDTLLLAEAFWLLEGYFVRTLGMHRVYNSAFMNMIRDEENASYRQVIKNTLEFDPEVLRRFVNFMNNPDERTAVDQFGKEGKYFGACLLMITMPGLPMFGHGQVEGFEEKYGMEYRRAYWDETPDRGLVERHEREIFPLLHLRHLFAGVEHFLLYDFFTLDGGVNEDVFAYSNRYGNDRSLVVYHNKYADTSGWIRTSVAYSVKSGQGENRTLVQKTVGEGLSLSHDDRAFTIFRDHMSNLFFLRSNREIHEKGLYTELGAYGTHVFLDFREMRDNEWDHYARLASHLAGRGVLDPDYALREMLLQPLLNCFKELVNADLFQKLWNASSRTRPPSGDGIGVLLDDTLGKAARLLREVKAYRGAPGDETEETRATGRALETLVRSPLRSRKQKVKSDSTASEEKAYPSFLNGRDNPRPFYTLLAWIFARLLSDEDIPPDLSPDNRPNLIDLSFFTPVMTGVFQDLGMEYETAERTSRVIALLLVHDDLLAPSAGTSLDDRLAALFEDPEARLFLGVNEYEGVFWYSREGLREFLSASLKVEVFRELTADGKEAGRGKAGLEACERLVERLIRISERSGYRVETLLGMVRDGGEV